MKKGLLTLLAGVMLTIGATAQITEWKDKKNPETTNEELSVQDSTSVESEESNTNESGESKVNSRNNDDDTATQEDKRNNRGKRSRVRENETGNERRKSEQDNP